MKYAILMAALVGCWAVDALAQCQPPMPVAGLQAVDTADRQAMLQARQRVREYLVRAEAYLDCLDVLDEEAGADDGFGRHARIAAYSQVMAEMHATVAEFAGLAQRFNQR